MPGSWGIALDGDQFAREVRAFRRQLARGVLLRYFQPQRDGLADIRQRLRVRGTLRMAAGERRTGNSKAFLRLNDDNMVLHRRSFAQALCERQEFFNLVTRNFEPVPRRVNPATSRRICDLESLRPRRIKQAAREVARSGHHAERNQFLARDAVVDEVPVERLFHEIGAQIRELRFGVVAQRAESRMLREKLQRRFHGARVIEGQCFVPLPGVPAGLLRHVCREGVGIDDAQAHAPRSSAIPRRARSTNSPFRYVRVGLPTAASSEDLSSAASRISQRSTSTTAPWLRKKDVRRVHHFAGGNGAIEIGGTAAVQFGRITINGSAALAGTLNLSSVNGFDPALGSSFNGLTYTSHTGRLDTVNGSIGNSSRIFRPSSTISANVGSSSNIPNVLQKSPLAAAGPDRISATVFSSTASRSSTVGAVILPACYASAVATQASRCGGGRATRAGKPVSRLPIPFRPRRHPLHVREHAGSRIGRAARPVS